MKESHNRQAIRMMPGNLFWHSIHAFFRIFPVINAVKEVKDLYDAADVFLSPSRSEAFAYAVAEASYCDCQVIASDVPGQNTMKDIPGIIWIEPDSIESLENAILAAMERKSSAAFRSLKASQREYVLNHYGIAEWV